MLKVIFLLSYDVNRTVRKIQLLSNQFDIFGIKLALNNNTT